MNKLAIYCALITLYLAAVCYPIYRISQLRTERNACIQTMTTELLSSPTED